MVNKTNTTDKLVSKIVNEVNKELQKVIYHEIKTMEKRLLSSFNKLLEQKINNTSIAEQKEYSYKNSQAGLNLKKQIDNRNAGLSTEMKQSLKSVFTKSPVGNKVKFTDDPVLNELLNSTKPVESDYDDGFDNYEETYGDVNVPIDLETQTTSPQVNKNVIDVMNMDYSNMLKKMDEAAQKIRPQ